jgi:hypothetical protein
MTRKKIESFFRNRWRCYILSIKNTSTKTLSPSFSSLTHSARGKEEEEKGKKFVTKKKKRKTHLLLGYSLLGCCYYSTTTTTITTNYKLITTIATHRSFTHRRTFFFVSYHSSSMVLSFCFNQSMMNFSSSNTTPSLPIVLRVSKSKVSLASIGVVFFTSLKGNKSPSFVFLARR